MDHRSSLAPVVKNLPAVQETLSSILGSGRFPEEQNGNPLQYSGLGNAVGRGSWLATVHGVATARNNRETQPPLLKSLLSLLQFCFCFMFWFLGPWVMWDLSFPPWDQTLTPCIISWGLNHWTAKEVPALCGVLFFFFLFKYFFCTRVEPLSRQCCDSLRWAWRAQPRMPTCALPHRAPRPPGPPVLWQGSARPHVWGQVASASQALCAPPGESLSSAGTHGALLGPGFWT